jgi:hypothetical protein
MDAFVHIEKTAGRTIKAILQRSFGSGHCDIRPPCARRAGEARAQKAIDLLASRVGFASVTETFDEPLSGRLVRNWVYKPLRVLRLA